MKIVKEERVLIKDIFNIGFEEKDNPCIILKNFNEEVSQEPNQFSLVQHPNYFDSMLMECLQMPKTNILPYLMASLDKSEKALTKHHQESSQKFIRFVTDMIDNYIYLSQVTPEVFPEQHLDPETNNHPPMRAVAARLTRYFEKNQFSAHLFKLFYGKNIEEIEGDFLNSFFDVLYSNQKQKTALSPSPFALIRILKHILGISEIKQQFLNRNIKNFSPEGVLKFPGSFMDKKTPLGQFYRLSPLGFSPSTPKQQHILKEYQHVVINNISQINKKQQMIHKLAHLHSDIMVELEQLFKILLKEDSRNKFFQYLYAIIITNINRTKLVTRMQGFRTDSIAHDGFMLNFYGCLLNLLKPILNKTTNKYEKIDPQYHMSNKRVKVCKYQSLNTKKSPPLQQASKQFGTTTEFFFLTLQFMVSAVLPAQQTLIELAKRRNNVLAHLKKQKNIHIANKYKHDYLHLEAKTLQYGIILHHANFIDRTINLLSLVHYLLPLWLKFDYQLLTDCSLPKYQPSILVFHLPEHLLQVFFKFHLNNLKTKPHYINHFHFEHVNQIINLTCILLSDMQISSNPFIGAGFVQLLSVLGSSRKKQILEAFKNHKIGQKNLNAGLINFYCNIAITGSRNQFYEKFKYRLYANKIFTEIWKFQQYQQNLKEYFKIEVFQKFLHLIMSDTTFCFDETTEKYEKYKQIEAMKSNGNFNQQAAVNQTRISSQIQSTLQHSSSNLRLLKQFSKWSPETFYAETMISDFVMLLNNILQTFTEPTSFVTNRPLLGKLSFSKEQALSHLIEIYANLDINEKLIPEIMKDTRYFKKQNFLKALQKASNDHKTSIEILEQFEILIAKLQTTEKVDNQDEIFGEIPDRYLCALMSTLMKEPVQLPSGYIVDKVYIHKHLINDQRDPFTRAPMKNGQWKERVDICEEIMVWKKKRLTELKNGNKEVKYGSKTQKIPEEKYEDEIYNEQNIPQNFSGEEEDGMEPFS